MKRFYQFLMGHKKAIALAVGLLAVGSLLRWEDKQVTDARRGRQVATYRGIAFPWQPWDRGNIRQLPKGTTINFHVRHWLLYGLLKMEATGQTVIL